MNYFRHIFLILFFLYSKIGFSQEENLSFGNCNNVQDLIEVKYLPKTGNFATIQICVTGSNVTYNSEFFSHFILIKPIFVLQDSLNLNLRRYSLGIYNSVKDAELIREKIICVFPEAFVVTYQNGKRVQKETFSNGNIKEQKLNIKEANKTCKKVLKKSYWRLQFGYYEEDSLNLDEQMIYDTLNKMEIKVIQEKYKQGRLYLSEQKYFSYDEVDKIRKQVEEIIGRDIILKPYFDFPEIRLENIEKIHKCLRK